MLTLTPPDANLRATVASVLQKRWMPGDWFELTDAVVGHYAWKAAICLAAWKTTYHQNPFPIIEIGTRCGYSLTAFRVALAGLCDPEALCFDAGLDADSPACLQHFREWVAHNRIPAKLVEVNTLAVAALPPCAFAHVDADHTTPGALRDLWLVRDAGVILADDCDNAEVRAAVMAFINDNPQRGVQFVNDGLRTLGVISWDGPPVPKG